MAISALALVVVMCQAPAPAQGPPPVRPERGRPMLLPGIQYGTPLGLAAGLTVFLPTADLPGFRRGGFVVEATAGQGGARLAFGPARFVENLGIDARAVVARTFDSPRGASGKSTYAGVEAGLTLAYVRVSAGVARRIAGPDGADATIFAWSAGFHFPLHVGRR